MEQNYDEEIDLLDLLYRICKKWRLMLLWALICGVVVCGYQVYSNQKAKDALEDKLNIKVSSEKLQEELTQIEKKKVDEAVKLYQSLVADQEYLENSVYLNLDYYNEHGKVLQYVLNGVTNKDKDAGIESALLNTYVTYVNNLSELEGISLPAADLNSLISAYISNAGVSNSKVDTIANKEVLVINIKGDSADMTQEIAAALTQALNVYGDTLANTYGTHTLSLVDEQSTVGYDSTIESDRNNSKIKIEETKAKLETMVGEFSPEQKNVYDAILLENQLELDDAEPVELTDGIVKMAVIGVLLGIILVCCYEALFYILGGKLRTSDSITKRYNLFLQGEYSFIPEEGRKLRGVDKLLANLKNPSKLTREQITDQVVTNMQLSLGKVGGSTFCLLSTAALEDADKELIQGITGRIGSKQGAAVKLYDDCAHGAEGIKEAAAVKNVVLVEKVDTTRIGDVDRLYRTLSEYDIKVLGVIVI